jgi:hypothetical protein
MSCSRMAGSLAARACRRNHRLNRLGLMGVPPGMVKARPLSAYCGPYPRCSYRYLDFDQKLRVLPHYDRGPPSTSELPMEQNQWAWELLPLCDIDKVGIGRLFNGNPTALKSFQVSPYLFRLGIPEPLKELQSAKPTGSRAGDILRLL